MTRQGKVLVVRLLICLSTFLWGCTAGGPTVNITGQWTGSLTYTTGTAAGFVFPFTISMVHEDRTLQGEILLRSHGDLTYALPITSGRVRGMDVLLVALGSNPWVPGDPAVEMTLDGVIAANVISGVGTHRIDETIIAFTWEATRTPEPPSDS